MTHAPVTTIYMHDHPVDILRLELAQPRLQGNKFYKLKYNIERFKQENCDTLLTFGGVFSNHIHAAATACYDHGIRGVAVLRGEDDPFNPTLKFIRSMGMETIFVSRELYRQRNNSDFLHHFSIDANKIYVLPEGGTNEFAVRGCSEILGDLADKYDRIFCAVGTGGTLCGLICSPGLSATVTGISSLKADKDSLTPYIRQLCGDAGNKTQWDINFQYHFGGYAKYNDTLMAFVEQFEHKYNIKPDPVYTAKVFYAVNDMISNKSISASERILILHTGGLQGWDGWHYRFHHPKKQSHA
ncbi:MAG TPA: pyridoxal-phosphate dependent enzyme [Chitinophagales bacterium]|nr:pyridoxal-phosphate dependent enzyme [Chitinophagales bacterium]HNI53075.1 pyridoxal-phosphate dependent enzyme [Chitinophagales bacterium]